MKRNQIITIITILSLFFISARSASASVFTVNSTGDASDANPGDGVCETSTPGECTLRAAIEEANADPGTALGLE
jgi:CSLREA domain-containing protein